MRILNQIPYLLILLIGFPLSGFAEDSIVDRNVTVEREYKPIIQDAGKIKFVPEVLVPNVDKIQTTYSQFNYPLNADFNIHILPAAELQREKRVSPSTGFARIGAGNYKNTLADFVLPIIKKPTVKLDFSLNHYGTFDSKAHSQTKTALSFDKYFKTFNLYAGLGAGHEYLKYYGNAFNATNKIINLDTLALTDGTINYLENDLVRINRLPQLRTLNDLTADVDTENFWRINAFMGLRSLPLAEGRRFIAELKYKVFDTQNGLSEKMIQTKGGFSTDRGKNRLGIDLEMNNLFYSTDNNALLNFWKSYSVFSMNPYYSWDRKYWNIRLGANSSFSFIHGKPFNPSADISSEWKVVPTFLSIYGGIKGGYTLNSMDKMFAENRYLYSDVRVKDTYSPYDFFGGIKIKPIYNLLLDAYVDYRRIDNQYFLINKGYSTSSIAQESFIYSNRFNVIYSSANHLKIGVRGNYNYKNVVNIQFKGAYNHWDVSSENYAWNQPIWESDLSTSLKFTKKISVDANVYVDGGRYAKLGNLAIQMAPRVDINLGSSYTIVNWFSIFAKANNIANSKYQDFYGYNVQGFNFLIGGAFSF